MAYTPKAMIVFVLEESESRDIHSVYYGPYSSRLAARKDLDRAGLDATKGPGLKIIHTSIFNVNTPDKE